MENKLNIDDWKEFKIGDLFKKQKVYKFSKSPQKEGATPFITSTWFNNGIYKYVEVEKKYINPGNALTISTNGKSFKTFYHSKEFAASSDVEILYSDFLNENIGIFLATIFTKEHYKYSYNNKAKNGKVFDTIIKLPAILKGDGNFHPDFKKMNDYMNYLKEKDRKRILNILN
ncbi:restriction endonuclease subunit S [Candidatus Mycoplasma pogonae]